MNKIKKIGLSALAGSLVAMSVNAAEMSVTGGASLTISDQGQDVEGNTWTMGNSITFAASGETDSGISVSASYELDDDIMDDYSMSIGTAELGTLTFAGSGGNGALSAVDDVTPNAYEEAWHGAYGTGTKVDGTSGINMFKYDSPSFAGVKVSVGYLPASDAVTDKSYTDYGISFTPEMVDGLSLGYATGDVEETTGTTSKESTVYVKYTYGPVTFGYQQSEADGNSATTDYDTEALGITYAVNESLTIGYGTHKWETVNNASLSDQESSAITASFTTGGVTIAGIMNDVDNVSGVATTDREAYELNLSFAF
jgi:outer membrane protein OmpU